MRELEDRLGADELLEWMAFFELEPWGEERLEIMLAQICSLLANQWRGKGQRAARPQEFLPDYGGLRKRQRKPQSVSEMIASLRTHTAILGGEVK